MKLSFGLAILIVAAASCGHMGEKSSSPGAFPFNERIGWFHGRCLAVANTGIARGTAVALVIAGEPQTVQQARIQGQTNSPEECQALMEGRAKMNAKPGTAFYALEGGSVDSTDMGFGIVAPLPGLTVENGLARADLDRDGRFEVFSSCGTSEGIKFAVWTGKPYQGEPRWSGYYYLDYDIQPNCP